MSRSRPGGGAEALLSELQHLSVSPSLLRCSSLHGHRTSVGSRAPQPHRSCGDRGPSLLAWWSAGAAQGHGPRAAPRTLSLRAGRPGRWHLQGRPRISAAGQGVQGSCWHLGTNACRPVALRAPASFGGIYQTRSVIYRPHKANVATSTYCLTPSLNSSLRTSRWATWRR